MDTQLRQMADAAAAALLAEEEAESRAKQGRRGRKGKVKVKGAEVAAQPSAGALSARDGGASTPGTAAQASTSGGGATEALCGLSETACLETKSALGAVPADTAEVADVRAAQREKKRLKEKQRKERQNQAKLGEARDAVRAHVEDKGGGGGSGALEDAVEQLRRMLRRQASTDEREEELEGLLAAGAAKLEEVQQAERAAAKSRTLEAFEENMMPCAGARSGDAAGSSVQRGGLGLSAGPPTQGRPSAQPSGKDMGGLAREDEGVLRGPSSSSSLAATDVEGNLTVCVVCCDRRKDTLFLPCKHMCTCTECAVQLEKRKKKEGFMCPVCRVAVKDYVAGIFL
eukprot:gene353-658_t